MPGNNNPLNSAANAFVSVDPDKRISRVGIFHGRYFVENWHRHHTPIHLQNQTIHPTANASGRRAMIDLASPGNLFAIFLSDESAKVPAANDMADGYDIAGSQAFKLSGIDHAIHSHAASTAVAHDRIEVVGSRAALDHGVACWRMAANSGGITTLPGASANIGAISPGK